MLRKSLHNTTKAIYLSIGQSISKISITTMFGIMIIMLIAIGKWVRWEQLIENYLNRQKCNCCNGNWFFYIRMMIVFAILILIIIKKYVEEMLPKLLWVWAYFQLLKELNWLLWI
jgi:hypothetical protein